MKQPSSSFVFDEGCFFIIHENLNFPIVHWEKDLTKSFLRNLATLEFAKKIKVLFKWLKLRHLNKLGISCEPPYILRNKFL